LNGGYRAERIAPVVWWGASEPCEHHLETGDINYLFKHCSLCFRVRMMAALMRPHRQETVILDDDSDTMIAAVGKRIISIVGRDDGKPTLEDTSIAIAIHSHPPRTQRRRRVGRWSHIQNGAADDAALSAARAARVGTAAALDRYTVRTRKALDGKRPMVVTISLRVATVSESHVSRRCGSWPLL